MATNATGAATSGFQEFIKKTRQQFARVVKAPIGIDLKRTKCPNEPVLVLELIFYSIFYSPKTILIY